MKIKMLETQRGSVDGCRVRTYEAGVEYDLSASAGAKDLARAFVEAGFAKAVGANAEAHEPTGEVVAEPVAAPEEAAPEAAEPVQVPAQGRGRRKK